MIKYFRILVIYAHFWCCFYSKFYLEFGICEINEDGTHPRLWWPVNKETRVIPSNSMGVVECAISFFFFFFSTAKKRKSAFSDLRNTRFIVLFVSFIIACFTCGWNWFSMPLSFLRGLVLLFWAFYSLNLYVGHVGPSCDASFYF